MTKTIVKNFDQAIGGRRAKRMPVVVIVGRPNVGKSSLLNMLAGKRVSIVDPTPGVTRDRVGVVVEVPGTPGVKEGQKGYPVEVIDTGGYGIEDVQGLTSSVERQIFQGLEGADLVLFVVDAQAGVVPLDERVGQVLRRSGVTASVVVVANKVDGPAQEAGAQEAAGLGFGEPVMVSAVSGHQKAGLWRVIREYLDDWPPPELAPAPPEEIQDGEGEAHETGLLIAIAGKRNAGKSTLVNTLAGEERVIVSEVPGTTRDSVDVRFELDGRVFTAIDTAGVRKTKSLAGDIEFYSHHRTLRSVRRADVVLLLIDAAEPISQVDKQLANEILKHYKPCIVVLNKWDLAQKGYSQDEYVKYLNKTLKGLDFAPVAFVSAVKGEGIRPLITMAQVLHEQAGRRVGTGELNRVIKQIFEERTPVSKAGKRPKIYYATQLAVHPPTIGLFVNDPALLDAGYQRWLMKRLRDLLPYPEVPIKLLIRGRERAGGAGSGSERGETGDETGWGVDSKT